MIYESECSGSKRVADDRTLKSIEVPWIEAARIRAGEYVDAVVDSETRRGRIVWVARTAAPDRLAPANTVDIYTKDAQIQLREFRVDSATTAAR